MISADVLDVILRVQNLRAFQTRMEQASASVKQVGITARSQTGMTAAVIAKQAKKAMLAVGALAAATGLEAYKMTVSFDRQMLLIHTQAGIGEEDVKRMRKSILDMGGSVPYGPEELAKGMYHLASVTHDANLSMSALKQTAALAAVGNADLEETTNAVGTAMYAGLKGTGSLEHLLGLMNATVGAGNMRMDDLSTALGTGILPAAKVAGLGITDVFGALALLKDEGWGSYGSMAQLATAFHFLQAPTDKATKAFHSWHMGQLDISRAMIGPGGLPAALTMLRDRITAATGGFGPGTAEFAKEIAKVLPGGRGRVMLVLMQYLERYRQKIDQVKGTTDAFGEAQKKTMEEPAVRLKNAWAGLQTDMILLGDTVKDTMTPALLGLIGIFAWLVGKLESVLHHTRLLKDIFGPLIAAWVAYKIAVFTALAVQIAWNAVTTVGAFLALIPAITSLADAWVLLDIAMDANPIGLIAAAIVLLGLVIYLAVKHIHGLGDAAKAVWGWISANWPTLLAIMMGPFGWTLLAIKHFHGLRDAAKDTWHAMKSGAGDAAHWVAQRFRDLVAFLKRVNAWIEKNVTFGNLAHQAGKLIKPGIRKFAHQVLIGHASGGTIGDPRMRLVGEYGPELAHFPVGTRITPFSQLQPAFGGGRGSRPPGDSPDDWSFLLKAVHPVHLDKKPVGEMVAEYLVTKRARK